MCKMKYSAVVYQGFNGLSTWFAGHDKGLSLFALLFFCPPIKQCGPQPDFAHNCGKKEKGGKVFMPAKKGKKERGCSPRVPACLIFLSGVKL